ncbi:hypothetical protein LFM09_29710 [Lentzea alba]|uniref:hypothetical protein n=1 Tax=Lentzea alba TaxID=2714351 RepID=UPI0039BF3034
MELTGRVKARVRTYFPAEDVEEALAELAGVETGGQDVERVHAAVLLAAMTSLERLKELVALSRVDWRDVLVAGGLADGDWRGRLERGLGSVGAPPGSVSERVATRVRRDFPKHADEALQELATTYGSRGPGGERIQAAVVLAAKGDLRRLKSAVRGSHRDYRDTLMGAGEAHAHDDWPEVLRREFPEPQKGRRR